MKLQHVMERVSPSRLYHWTSFTALPEILQSNTLEARRSEFSEEPGVSFSRVPTATGISKIRPVVMVFDRDRVQHNHRLVPKYGDIQQASDFIDASGGEYEQMDVQKETEEKVLGNVGPIDRLLTHLVFQPMWYKWMVEGYIDLQIAKQQNRRSHFTPASAAQVMEWVANHPVGILPTEDLTAAWTRRLDTDSVYPSQWDVPQWKEQWKAVRGQ